MQYMVHDEILKHYTTDISTAWEVVDHFRSIPETGISIASLPSVKKWVCTIEWLKAKLEFIDVSTDTAPLAICLAALKAVGVDVDKELKK